MSIRSNNWIMTWCGLEISMVSFIPLIINKLIISSESSIKYFIVQRVRSIILMLSIMVIIIKGEYNYNYILITSLLIKVGASPFHNWVLTVLEGLNYYSAIILLTIGKLTPLTLINYIKTNLIVPILLTTLIGSIISLNQNSIKKIIGYSSIFNIALIISILKVNLLWIGYLILYSIIIIILIKITINNKTIFINQMVFSDIIVNKLTLWIVLLSMGGLPPLIGFSLKLITISYLTEIKSITLISIIIITSLMIIVLYLRITFISILNNSILNKNKMFNLKRTSIWIIIINLTTIPIALSAKIFT